MRPPDITIRSLAVQGLSDRERDAIEAIFFDASHTRSFADDAARRQFRERWLGRYLASEPEACFLARAGGEVVGYLAGTLENAAGNPRFADIGYFQAFAAQCARYPAHLHINLAPAWRGRLIDAFAELARAQGVAGLHVVTSEGARNVTFYQRCGFVPQATTGPPGARLLFLGRRVV